MHLLCICFVFHHILVVHFWYTSWSFLCWAILLVFSLLATHLCCFSMFPCYVLLLLFGASMLGTFASVCCLFNMNSCCSSMTPYCVLLLFFNPSLFCASSAPQHCCIICFLCSSASLCYVFWLLFNAFLLCVFGGHQHLLLHIPIQVPF